MSDVLKAALKQQKRNRSHAHLLQLGPLVALPSERRLVDSARSSGSAPAASPKARARAPRRAGAYDELWACAPGVAAFLTTAALWLCRARVCKSWTRRMDAAPGLWSGAEYVWEAEAAFGNEELRRVVARFPFLASLRARCGRGGGSSLVHCAALPERWAGVLRALSLEGCAVAILPSLVSLRDRGFAQLQHLDLSRTGLCDAHLAAFDGCCPRDLRALLMNGTQITELGLQQLTQFPLLRRLEFCDCAHVRDSLVALQHVGTFFAGLETLAAPLVDPLTAQVPSPFAERRHEAPLVQQLQDWCDCVWEQLSCLYALHTLRLQLRGAQPLVTLRRELLFPTQLRCLELRAQCWETGGHVQVLQHLFLCVCRLGALEELSVQGCRTLADAQPVFPPEGGGCWLPALRALRLRDCDFAPRDWSTLLCVSDARRCGRNRARRLWRSLELHGTPVRGEHVQHADGRLVQLLDTADSRVLALSLRRVPSPTSPKSFDAWERVFCAPSLRSVWSRLQHLDLSCNCLPSRLFTCALLEEPAADLTRELRSLDLSHVRLQEEKEEKGGGDRGAPPSLAVALPWLCACARLREVALCGWSGAEGEWSRLLAECGAGRLERVDASAQDTLHAARVRLKETSAVCVRQRR